MKNLPGISDAEFEIMQVIWDNYPISTNEITNKVMENSKWNMRTIHTLIFRLCKKGVISYCKKGKVYVYTPLIKKEDYIKEESKNFLGKFYNGAVKSMILNFIENDILSDDEIKELKEIINKR